jgi:hypothetical protein
MTIVIAIAVGYVVVGVIWGLYDLDSLYRQDEYFSTIPIGDLEFYEKKKILGKHNFIFITSWLVLKPFLL